jgi:hypothetical protein
MGDPQLYICVSGTLVKAWPCGCGALVFAAAALGHPGDADIFDAAPCVASYEMVAGQDAVFFRNRPHTSYCHSRHVCPKEPTHA